MNPRNIARVRPWILAALLAALVTMAPATPPQTRMAAWGRSIVGTHEASANTSVMTYMTQRASYTGTNVLAKFTVQLEDQPSARPRQVEVEDFPGGVTARFSLADVSITAEVTPLLVGPGRAGYEGAVLYRVSSNPPVPLRVGIGGPGEQTISVPRDIRRHALLPIEQLAIEGRRARYVSGIEGVNVALHASGELEAVPAGEDGGQALQARLAGGAGSVLLAYAARNERLLELASLDPRTERDKVAAHYEQLLQARIDTPEPALDGAFRSALYNLEYNWNEPYGWNECIHHWLAMWHNQHTAAAEWIGQKERSRLCTLTHARQLLASGAVPQFFFNGLRRRDFGGSNQFWTWQARHYWRFTADLDFVREVAPTLDRVLAQTIAEHDAGQNGLFGWGLQIGNQEDFIHFNNDGATPTIEVINMMRTRAEFARALDDLETARHWSARADRARDRLIDHLWLPDLGRFASHRDAQGFKRLEGQYHTFLYPVLWDVIDELDGYASLRHVHDRLTGPGGEVYCSNNFPNHNNGSWGMQAGAAQQPWAAWAFARAGQRNHAFRPLLAIAREVMGERLRGAWPEVMLEDAPAYFTPPAGLYVASVIESLFGLEVDMPRKVLHVAPCFPDAWPEASLALPEYSADFRREGTVLTYVVRSGTALARHIRWSLPPARVLSFKVDGEPVPFRVSPGVQRVILEARTPSARETTIELKYEPLEWQAIHVGSVAGGDVLEVQVRGARISRVDDRFGILASSAIEPHRVEATVRDHLLDPYLDYGRLGQLTFSRRTFFLQCEAGEVRFWVPVDVTILPRYEAAAAGEVTAVNGAYVLPLRIRNNTASPLHGPAMLTVARNDLPLEVNLNARDEATLAMALPDRMLGLLSAGDNRADLTLPSGESIDLMFPVTRPFAAEPVLNDLLTSRLVRVELPDDVLSPWREWRHLREPGHGGPVAWPQWRPPLDDIEEQARFEVDGLPGVHFEVEPGKWALVGERIGRPGLRIPIEPGPYKKFFLMLAVFADNHDLYTRLGHVTLRNEHGVVLSKGLHMPGDLDWWEKNGMNDTMGTARYGRPDRLGLLPLLPAALADWSEGPQPDLPPHDQLVAGRQRRDVPPMWTPPSFPQPQYWAASRVLDTPACVFNVIEIDLGQPTDVTSLDLASQGIGPGFALYAVTAEKSIGTSMLEDTRWMPEARFRAPSLLFDLSEPGAATDWELEQQAVHGEVFGYHSLNTLIHGESATGRALSPVFTLPPDAVRLVAEIVGGFNDPTSTGETLALRLIDAGTGEVLRSIHPPGSHVPAEEAMDLSGLGGREVRLEMLDRHTGEVFAWIGLLRVKLLSGP